MLSFRNLVAFFPAGRRSAQYGPAAFVLRPTKLGRTSSILMTGQIRGRAAAPFGQKCPQANYSSAGRLAQFVLAFHLSEVGRPWIRPSTKAAYSSLT